MTPETVAIDPFDERYFLDVQQVFQMRAPGEVTARMLADPGWEMLEVWQCQEDKEAPGRPYPPIGRVLRTASNGTTLPQP
jgi:hypothetical protein